jgi:hypothetical protein
MDQTANLCLDALELSLYKSKVLLIGSGQDLDGRAMADVIHSDYYDYVCKLNKSYGAVEDVGTRCDILFTRWSSWISAGSNFIEPGILYNTRKVVILNQNVNYSRTERTMISKELQLEHVSAGPQAVQWLLNRGCKHIDLIGFGYKNGEFMTDKVYAKNSKNYPDGMKDTNTMYNWQRERQWLMLQPEVRFI